MDEKQLIERIKILRKERNLTQAEVAHEVAIPPRTYQRIENQETPVKLKQLIDVLNFLDPDFTQKIKQAFKNDENALVSIKYPVETKLQTSTLTGRQIFEIELLKTIFSRQGNESCLHKNLVGYWEININQEQSYFSEEIWLIYDLERSKSVSIDTFAQRIDSSEWNKINQSITELIHTGKPYYSIHHVTHRDGKRYKIEANARRFELANGEYIVFGLAEVI